MAKNDGSAAPSPRRRRPRVPIGALLLFAAAILLFLVGSSSPRDPAYMDGAVSKEGAGVGSCALPGSHAEAVEAAEGVLTELPSAVEKELGGGAGPGERIFAEAVVRQEERKAANKKAKNERKSKKAVAAAQKSKEEAAGRSKEEAAGRSKEEAARKSAAQEKGKEKIGHP